MKTKRLTLLCLALCLVALALTACSGSKSLMKAQDKAIESLTGLKCEATVKDGSNVVYIYSNTMSISGDDAVVTIAETKLNSFFVLEEKSVTDQAPLDRNNFAKLNFSKDVISEISQKDGVYTVIVSDAKASALFGKDVAAKGDITITAEVGENLQKMVVEFAVQSGKTVSIVYTYIY